MLTIILAQNVTDINYVTKFVTNITEALKSSAIF